MSDTAQPIVCLCPASEFRNCSDTECPNSGANAAEPVDEDSTSELVARIRDRVNDAPMPTEHLLDEAADEIVRLRGLVMHYADQSGVPADEVRRVHNV